MNELELKTANKYLYENEKCDACEKNIEEDDQESNSDITDEPQEDDCFITDKPHGGYEVSCGGKFVGQKTDFEDALKMVNDWRKKSKYFPNIWMVSDHGNMILIDDKGNEIK